MAGVVASALHVRAQGHAGTATQGRETRDGDATSTHRRRHRDEPLPAECEPKPGSPPKAEVALPGGALDFGPLRQGVVVEKDVEIRNLGTGVLCVLDLDTGCGCVKATWVGDNHVPPGGKGTLRVRLDTAGRDGPIERTLTLYTNEPGRKSIQFKVRGDVRLGLIVAGAAGQQISFGLRPPKKATTVPVRLRCPKDEPPWEVVAVESALDAAGEATKYAWEVVAAEPPSPEFRDVDLRLTHPGTAKLGAESGRVRIRTSHPERPEILLDTQILVVPKYYPQPKQVSILRVRPDSPAARTISILAAEPEVPFRVLSAKVEGTGFLAGEPRTVPGGQAVDVRYDQVARGAGRVKATLVVSIDDPELPEVRVPLEADVLGP
jgi:hypothetical protein